MHVKLVFAMRAGRHGSGGQIFTPAKHPERAAYQDRWEILRDASHVRTLPLTELLQLFRDQGLETDAVTTADDLQPRWNAGWLPPGLPHTRPLKRAACWKKISCVI